MKFKRPALEMEFHGALHPEVRQLVLELDEYSQTQHMPEPLVTMVLRTVEEQIRIYKPQFLKQGLSEEAAKQKAAEKFSWHLVACGIDLRNSHYTQAQLAEVMSFLRRRCLAGRWELLQHDVGRGDHIHLARRDAQWRATYPKHAVRKEA